MTSQPTSWTYDRTPDAPRRVRNGIRLRAPDGVVGRSWASLRLVRLLDRIVPDRDVRQAGLEYARRGQIVRYEISTGAIDAVVQGRRARPYRVRITVPAFDEPQWDDAIQSMAGEALYAAKMLDGEVPSALDDLLAARDPNLVLIPRDAAGITATCPCADPKPCKHVAAMLYILAERFDDEPAVMFDLRGHSLAKVIDRLHQIRAIQTQGGGVSHLEPVLAMAQPEAPALADTIESFWRMGAVIHELDHEPPAHHLPHALLRRLGPSPMQGRFPLSGLLASIYDSVSEHARRARDAD